MENSPGQAWILQDWDFSLDPEHVPPLLCCTVLDLVDFWVPTPQVLEHDPHADQFDH